MKQDKIFTAECFRYNTDKKKGIRLHNGTFKEVRDNLTPVMYWTREFFAPSYTQALLKVHALVKALNEKEPRTYIVTI